MAPTFSDYGQRPQTSERIALWVRPPCGSRQAFAGRSGFLLDSFLETLETPRAEKILILSRGSGWVL
jgi:hypothetical protein